MRLAFVVLFSVVFLPVSAFSQSIELAAGEEQILKKEVSIALSSLPTRELRECVSAIDAAKVFAKKSGFDNSDNSDKLDNASDLFLRASAYSFAEDGSVSDVADDTNVSSVIAFLSEEPTMLVEYIKFRSNSCMSLLVAAVTVSASKVANKFEAAE